MKPATEEIRKALEAGEDATGLCTVRQWASEILSMPSLNDTDWLEYEHNRARWRVRLIIESIKNV